MRDDLKTGRVALPAAARRYARMTSKQAMTAGWKPQAYTDMAAAVTGQQARQAGFANKSFGQTTAGRPLPRRRAGEALDPVDMLVQRLLND